MFMLGCIYLNLFLLLFGFSMSGKEKVFKDKIPTFKEFIESIEPYMNRNDIEDLNIMSLGDLRLLRLVNVTYLRAEGEDSATKILLIFDFITTYDSEYDIYIIIDLPRERAVRNPLDGFIDNINFLYKARGKSRVIRFFPHEVIPNKRFEGGKFNLEFFKQYIGGL